MTRIFHITHVDHLASIIHEGGLHCDRESARRNLAAVSIAHEHIKLRRARLTRICLGEGHNGMVRYIGKEVEAYEESRQVRAE
jgi:hypothetical protein